MAFNSFEYLLFLPLVVLLHAVVARSERARDGVLLVASYVFYMGWDWRYAGLIALSTVVDWSLGLRLARTDAPGVRKALVTASLVVNLGLLAVFKYWNFFFETARSGLAAFGIEAELPHSELLLPVGISFYTFQTLSYTLDLYRREIEPERSLTKFAVFVAFFPQLVAGPIVRARDFLPQLRGWTPVRREEIQLGVARIFRGLLKKVLIADLLAGLLVDPVFAAPERFSSLDLAFALYGYALQIYCDFSGYSDIAIGSAALLGFRLPENFRRPYLSRNVREFWTRWHISLSTWLRDYLYIPLGGSRRRTLRNLMLTMLLGGLWHGAALNFVVWGAYHGLLLVCSRAADRHGGDAGALHAWGQRLLTFHLVLFGWLLFRVTGWEHFQAFVGRLAEFEGGTRAGPLVFALLLVGAAAHLIPAAAIEAVQARWCRLPAVVQAMGYTVLVVLLAGAGLGSPQFIYFQF